MLEEVRIDVAVLQGGVGDVVVLVFLDLDLDARLLGEVLEGADDAPLGRELLYGSPDQVREAGYLPALDVDAVLEEGLALALVGRAEEGVGDLGRKDLPPLAYREPSLPLAVMELGGEVRCHDVAAQTDGDPLLALAREAIDGRVVDLVGLGLANRRQQTRNLLGGVILLCDDELQAGTPDLLAACQRVLAGGADALARTRRWHASRDARQGLMHTTTPLPAANTLYPIGWTWRHPDVAGMRRTPTAWRGPPRTSPPRGARSPRAST